MTPEQALHRVKARLIAMPTSRIVNTTQWDAVHLGDALNVVDQVIAELRETNSATKPSGVDRA